MSSHNDAADQAALKHLSVPGSNGAALIAATMAKYMQRPRSGVEATYLDAIGDPARAGWSPGQYLSAGLTLAGIASGQIGRVRLDVGATPAKDVSREENAAALENVHEVFTATVDMTQYNDSDAGDGTVRWAQAIMVSTDAGDVEVPSVDSGVSCPLEIGSCDASRVYLHLRQSGAVARWPYGSEEIWLFVGLPTPAAYIAANSVMAHISRSA